MKSARILAASVQSLSLLLSQVCHVPVLRGKSSKVFENAHGKTVRDVKHHMLLPHEIFGAFYRHGLLQELLFPNNDATWQRPLRVKSVSWPRVLILAATEVREFWLQQPDTQWLQSHPILTAAWL